MQKKQNRTLEALATADEFLDAHADALAAVNATGMRKKLHSIVVELQGFAANQGGSALSAQGSTQKHRSLRTVLVRDHMAPIALIARAELTHVPEIGALRLPAPRLTPANLAHAADAMAEAAAPFASTFTDAGLPADFIAQLTAASTAMSESLRTRTQSLGKRSGATSGLAARLNGGMTVLRAVDRLVRTALVNDPALLSTWTKVKRVRQTTRPIGAIVPTTPTAPATPATPAVAATGTTEATPPHQAVTAAA
jgi:hypothetical protein